MFTQTWKKYLPVITIMIKRSANEEQLLSLNHTDFERAAGGRKIKFSFTLLELNKGKINTTLKQTPLAAELAITLQEDETARKIISDQYLEFSMNNSCQLTIRNTTLEKEASPETEENDETTEVEEPSTKLVSS